VIESDRPDPDALLASLKRDEVRARRGSLKVFFGMCPGVGKTYAMLRSAQQELGEGIDLAVGVVETHGRAETEALLVGLPVIPRKQIIYKNIQLTEMDLEAILARKPRLVLVDELAHTNAPGSRHPKRYQDVIELLDAGIDVHTTLNVQHIESRADAVRQITGATVHETVPDSVFGLADQIELVDITPEALRERLSEGKVYMDEPRGGGGGELLQGHPPDGPARAGPALCGRERRQAPAGAAVRHRPEDGVALRRAAARRGRPEPLLHAARALDAANGGVPGRFLDRGERRGVPHARE
jgi:hypothetical protein